MTPQQFIAKWKDVTLTERSACQSHFRDLCDLLNEPDPVSADPDGSWYTFEKGVKKEEGGHGFADVWKRAHFGWEYKKKRRNLDDAYKQLLQYREDLENPPLLVVCDMDRIEVHTNFTGTIKRVFKYRLEDLDKPETLDVLRCVFSGPEGLKPGVTSAAVTEKAAVVFGEIADGLRLRNEPAPEVAHFLMKLMFCLFAEDVNLLQDKLFSRLVAGFTRKGTGGKIPADPGKKLSKQLAGLFHSMAVGEPFGVHQVLHFNGGLFADARTIDLLPAEIEKLAEVAALDWSGVEPSIFGTLFERLLDPEKRSQIGAHYTSRTDIETLLEPVVMQPLRREWEEVKAKADALLPAIKKEASARLPDASGTDRLKKGPAKTSARAKFLKLIRDFDERLAHVTILDPACGSGNFLYVALHLLLDLEKEVITYGARKGEGLYPQVRPTQLAGIEINPYAQELASVVIWIGYLQWMRDNGFEPRDTPVLEPMESITRMDSILDLSDPEGPKEPDWPEAEFIVGNPPFLGAKRIRGEIGHDYFEKLTGLYEGSLPAFSDLCCYWFWKAADQLWRKRTERVGLLATQAIRGGANRKVLDHVKERGDIFFAESDRDWILDGATVHVSMVGFDRGDETERVLDGVKVDRINSNLSSAADTTRAVLLRDNSERSFIGIQKSGPFDVSIEKALDMIRMPNPTSLPNSDVLRPYYNALDIVRRNQDVWIIDFDLLEVEQAAKYEVPFEYAKSTVKPMRDTIRRDRHRIEWWRYGETRQGLRAATKGYDRLIVTPLVAKHFVMAWCGIEVVVSNLLIGIATQSDADFGVLQSRIHEVWARCMGTQLRESESGSRYTPTTCFETFPFPEPTDAQRQAIADAARELDRLRNNWLNPPEWTRTDVLEFPGTVGGPWDRFIEKESAVRNQRAEVEIGTVKYPRVVAKDEDSAEQLAKRTLTNLYNQRPTWLDVAHRKLDEAVFAAYGWEPSISDEELLAKLLELNLQRAGSESGLTTKRKNNG